MAPCYRGGGEYYGAVFTGHTVVPAQSNMWKHCVRKEAANMETTAP